MKWYELAAAGVLGAFVLVVVLAGVEPRGTTPRAAAPRNLVRVAPPTVHPVQERKQPLPSQLPRSRGER